MEHLPLTAVLVILIIILTLGASPCASQEPGFQSINCGGGNFTDPKTKIEWTEDPYTNLTNELLYGSISKVESGFDNVTSVMTTLRYFSGNTSNRKFCYSFFVSTGITYLVRASFLYGNYDSRNTPPTFFLIINYDRWTIVTTSLSPSPIVEELVFSSKDDNLNICLATSTSTNHTPFISALELRPLEATMYNQSLFSAADPTGLSQGYGLQLWRRIDYGAKREATTRYPDDKYDRIWEGNTTGPTVSTNASNAVSSYGGDESQPPAAVLATAITVADPHANLSFTFEGLGTPIASGFRMELHFEEVDEQVGNGRIFGIAFPNSSDALVEAANNITAGRPIQPSQSSPLSVVLDQQSSLLPLPLRIALFPLLSSSFGPLLNAIELFYWTNQSLSTYGTSPGDVNAIMLIQENFKLEGYGQGDPCLPKGYEWTWISCSDDHPPYIIGINLASFNLTGAIPPSINNLLHLQSIDLSHNMLNGSIPNISSLNNLTYLDISYNNFCGRSPSFQRPIIYKYIGNNGLCDEPKCDCNARTSTELPKSSSTKKYILAICIMGALYIVIFIIFFFIYKAKFIGKTEDKATSIKQEKKFALGADYLKGLPYAIKMFTYNELNIATFNFTTVLGEGGFGKVYHGLLQTGEAIAVKILADASRQGLKEFYNEVAILSRVRHKNLVCLFGCCVENTYMLIYEYIEKGNLKDLLYGDMESAEKPLSWTTRLQIALDASKGLDYLHTGCEPPIIHRDVKTSNILLSDRMQAKLADFGLSRLKEGDNNISHISTINIVGTPGYLDPAYNATNQLTDKSDVYSFGIVLFELICGRAPIDMFKDPPHIADWATSLITQDKIEDIVDPMLANGYNVDSLWKVVDIAIGCVDNDRMHRPKMSQVFQALQAALEIEMNKSSLPFSEDINDSSSTSDEKTPTLQYIKAIQTKLQPR